MRRSPYDIQSVEDFLFCATSNLDTFCYSTAGFSMCRGKAEDKPILVACALIPGSVSVKPSLIESTALTTSFQAQGAIKDVTEGQRAET